MKLIYKLTIILAIFQFTVLIVNSLGGDNPIFPKESQFYSDSEINADIRDADSAWNATMYFFVPSSNSIVETVSISAIAAMIFIGGTISAFVTHSFVPIAFAFLLYIFFNMLTKSIGFINKMFYNWDNQSMIYLAICIGVAVFTIFIITIAETPTHGRSG